MLLYQDLVIIMIKDFKGKVGVITGAANGIGRSLAHAFAKRGMKLVITDINGAALNIVKDELQNYNVKP